MHLRVSTDHSVFLLLLSAVLVCVCGQQARLEYQYSFKPPYLTKSDGTIPFWKFGGHAIASEDSIRITPSLRNKRGWVWTAKATTFESWEVEISLRVTGRGRIGADGIAIWFTDQPGIEGVVYGSNDNWKGMGLFLDTYDNDQQHNNPTVLAVVNDGTMQYNHDGDGAQQSIGTCVRDFRNKPNPVRIRIRYYLRRLSVWLTNGLSEGDQFEPCFETPEITNFPARGYFGVSAATGALADDHDVQSFITHSLRDPDAPKLGEGAAGGTAASSSEEGLFSESQRQKFQSEFQQFVDKLKIAKTEFEKEHGGPVTESPENLYESESDRSVRQILALQSDTLTAIKQVQVSLNQLQRVDGRVEPGSVLQNTMPDLVRRDDLQAVQTTLNAALSGLRSSLDELQRKLGSVPAVPQDSLTLARIDSLSRDLTGSQNSLRDELLKLAKTNGQPQPVQTPCSCASSTLLMVLLALQIALLIAFQIYQKSREARAKKFY